MYANYQLPQETIVFINCLVDEHKDVRIRLIPNKNSIHQNVLKGCFDKRTLEEWSKLKASIYAVINKGGDCDDQITACRALFIEHDNLSLEKQANCWRDILPEPTIQVDTGGKSLHQYWVFKEPIEADRWRKITLRAIKCFDSDPTICNPARLMRLPGFRHYNKYGNAGRLSNIYSYSGEKYNAEELEQFLSHIRVENNLSGRYNKLIKSSNADWQSASPCPICGRDLDDKCRISFDQSYIQCHVGDTFWPPTVAQGHSINGRDSNIWENVGPASNCFGDALAFKILKQKKPEKKKVRTKSALISFVRENYGTSLAWNELKNVVEQNAKPIQSLELKHCELADKFHISHTPSNVRDAFIFISKENSYHPVQRYLASVEDLNSDVSLENLGIKYLKLSSTIQSKLFGLHLLASAKRAFSPGYPYDQILILRGGQGVGKTSTIKILAGLEYYISAAVVPTEKDMLMQLGQCWHYEIEEIDGHIDSRHDASLKVLISRHSDNYRVPYGSTTQDHPRPSVLWGSTNQQLLLVDTTGNRRFWLIDIEHPVDLDKIRLERDKIWGTVMQALRSGHTPFLTREEELQVAGITENAVKEDPWLIIIQAEIEGTPIVIELDILSKIFAIEKKHLKGGRSNESRRVKDCLRKLDYTPSPNQVNNLGNGWPKRMRGIWFAKGVTPTSNGEEVKQILTKAGRNIPSFHNSPEYF